MDWREVFIENKAKDGSDWMAGDDEGDDLEIAEAVVDTDTGRVG